MSQLAGNRNISRGNRERNELEQLLRAAGVNLPSAEELMADGYVTAQQLAQKTRVSYSHLRHVLRDMAMRGQIERVLAKQNNARVYMYRAMRQKIRG